MKKIEKPSKEFIKAEKALFKTFKEIFGIYRRGETLFVPEGVAKTVMDAAHALAKKAGLTVKVKAHKLKKEWTK